MLKIVSKPQGKPILNRVPRKKQPKVNYMKIRKTNIKDLSKLSPFMWILNEFGIKVRRSRRIATRMGIKLVEVY